MGKEGKGMEGWTMEKGDLAFSDDAAALAEDGGGDEDLLAYHGVVLVVRVVGIAELAVGAELELQELVPKLPLVPHVVPQVELVLLDAVPRHCRPSLLPFFFPLHPSPSRSCSVWSVPGPPFALLIG